MTASARVRPASLDARRELPPAWVSGDAHGIAPDRAKMWTAIAVYEDTGSIRRFASWFLDEVDAREKYRKRERSRTPYYAMVPKDYQENLKFRAALIELGHQFQEYRPIMRRMCADDLLFYVNAFCWTHDPRKWWSPARPFITYGFQDEALLEIDSAVGNHDLAIEKSRDMGASWMNITVLEWRWHFMPLQQFILGSRTEDYVDKQGEPKALFWKIDFLHQHQPGWLLPTDRDGGRKHLQLRNNDNGSVLSGESTTGDFARGGRATAILLDEFATVGNGREVCSATRDATRCRLYNSTPKGAANAFYDVTHDGKTRKLRLHWTLHPEKSKGLYYDERGKSRSPWYDEECDRAACPAEIAQELDIDYLGSDYQFFDNETLDRLKLNHTMEPYMRGDLNAENPDPTQIGFTAKDDGAYRFWLHFGPKNRPSKEREYVVGVDIAAGTGSSNSVISVMDRTSGEIVMEYADSRVQPHTLGAIAVGVCKFFSTEDKHGEHPAFLIWEANGPGRNFGDAVIGLGFRNVWFRTNEKDLKRTRSDVPGWFSTKDEKRALLGDFKKALSDEMLIVHSREVIEECRQYVYTPVGTIEMASATRKEDPTGARENHGDRVTSVALCWRASSSRTTVDDDEKKEIPPNSPMGRYLAEKRAAAKAEAW